MAQDELNTAQGQLDEKQKELDAVQAMYDAAMKEKQVGTKYYEANVVVFLCLIAILHIFTCQQHKTHLIKVVNLCYKLRSAWVLLVLWYINSIQVLQY